MSQIEPLRTKKTPVQKARHQLADDRPQGYRWLQYPPGDDTMRLIEAYCAEHGTSHWEAIIRLIRIPTEDEQDAYLWRRAREQVTKQGDPNMMILMALYYMPGANLKTLADYLGWIDDEGKPQRATVLSAIQRQHAYGFINISRTIESNRRLGLVDHYALTPSARALIAPEILRLAEVS